MVTREPRLLLVTRDRLPVRSAVEGALPGVPYTFLEGTRPARPSRIEAALLGSVAREGRAFDPTDYPKLRFVQRLFAGVDDVPFERFPATVQIASNAGGYAPSVAEHAVALALASARSIVEGQARVTEGRLRPPPAVRSLRGQTAVILGFGAIGQGIAERLRPFGARIEAVTRAGDPIPGCERVTPAARLREAVARGAFVFEARPLTRATRATIGAEELRAMPPDATLVNVGRAGTVDEEALYHHLRAAPSFRAAFDVWWHEDFVGGTIANASRIAALPNFLGSPHLGGTGPGAEGFALAKALENLGRYFQGKPPRYVVDRAEYLP